MSLEAYFTDDTPRVEGSSIVFQVEANKPASLRCRLIGGSATVECKSVVLPTPYRICKVIWPIINVHGYGLGGFWFFLGPGSLGTSIGF